MRKIAFVAVLALSTAFFCVSCDKEDPHVPIIEGLTLKNFPIMDGSTSTDPLVRTIACELLGYSYEWKRPPSYATWELSTNLPETFVEQRLKCSQTHGSFISLIDGSADIIFSARKISDDEKAYAAEKGVNLIETPIALDALVFIKHKDIVIKALTHKQLQEIYTGKIKNWNEVGGNDVPMVPFVRNRNSGSQELMESLVMTEPIPDGFYEDHFNDFQMVGSMYPLLTEVTHTPGGLGYSVFYYLTQIVRGSVFDDLTMIPINDVTPDKNTIKDRKYPFVAEVYMIIRSDLDKSSMANKIYELMQTDIGKQIISESGYVPY